MKALRDYIRFLLESYEHDDDKEDKEDNLLTEPDFTEERGEEDHKDEMSAVGGGGGGLAPSGQITGHTGARSNKLDKNRFGKRNYANLKKKK